MDEWPFLGGLFSDGSETELDPVETSCKSRGGPASETIRRGREKSSRDLLAALGVIFPWNPLSTLSFHQENSAIAEGLVPLRDPDLDFSELAVLCL